MGLFDRFKKAAAPAQPAVPAPVAAQGGPDALCAPVSGTAIAMSEVPDPVFSKEVLGKGCAVWPEGDVVFSPVSGSVTVTMDHAVGIMSESGSTRFFSLTPNNSRTCVPQTRLRISIPPRSFTTTPTCGRIQGRLTAGS